MYNNPYMQNYSQFNPQMMTDRIDNQITQLQHMKEQMKNNNQQPAINQTFQLAPTNNHTMRFANTIDDVINETVYYDTAFFSKDMSVLWIKNAKGDIKSYELTEIIPKDSKDFEIEYLKSQIEELKGMIKNDANVTDVDTEQDTTDTSGDDEQMEQQLKRTNPQAFQKYQMARKNNNPQELLNETINGFNPEQRQQWDNFMKQIGINTK